MRRWLSVVLILLLLFFVCLTTAFRWWSDARASALAYAKADASVEEVLGTGIHEPWLSVPRFNFRTPTRTLNIRVVGTKSGGRLYAGGVEKGERWLFSELFIKTDDGIRIDVDLSVDATDGR